MKILLIMDPGLPVPPQYYGGHERLVYLFAEEYHRLGHEVTLLAGPDSACSGKTVTFGSNNLKRSGLRKLWEILFVWRYLNKNYQDFDLIHNFGRLIYFFPILNSNTKKIMTYGRRVTPWAIRAMNFFPNKNIIYTACSNYCVGTGDVAGIWRTVYNAIDFEDYHLEETVADDAPLMFLGRLDKIKGAHNAIKVAQQTNNRLILAGNIPHTADNLRYYKAEIEPLIDGEQIKYVGPLNDSGKNKYLGQAKALLFPIEWAEPFGLVMIEAMACGTPVIAFNRGSVPEVVDVNVTGIIVKDVNEMTEAVTEVAKINRKACREKANERFNVHAIAQKYLALFD